MTDKTSEQRISELEQHVGQIIRNGLILAAANTFLVKQNVEQLGHLVATKSDQAALLKLMVETPLAGRDDGKQRLRDAVARIESTGERMEQMVAALNTKLNPPPIVPGL